jgi:acyl carrier protein
VTEPDVRLLRCFRATFPDVEPEQIPSLAAETLEQWDSLQTVILIAVLEEEFELRIPARDFPAMRSFSSVRDYLAEARRP